MTLPPSLVAAVREGMGCDRHHERSATVFADCCPDCAHLLVLAVLRAALTGEAEGSWKEAWGYGNEPSDRDCHWWAENGLEQIGPFEAEEEARAHANLANLLPRLAPDAEGA